MPSDYGKLHIITLLMPIFSLRPIIAIHTCKIDTILSQYQISNGLVNEGTQLRAYRSPISIAVSYTHLTLPTTPYV